MTKPPDPPHCNIDGVMLAAGLSKRMGAPKLLLDLGDGPALKRAALAALGSTLARVVLVSPPEREVFSSAIGPAASCPRLIHVVNPDPGRGMSSSLRIGLEAVSANAAGAMILLADQPMITSDVIDMLATFFMQDSSRIAAAAVRGRRTTPVIFPADLFQELMDARGDVGGREVLDRRGQRVSLFEVGPWYDDSDLDAPEDLEMIRLKITRPEPDLA